MANSMGQRMRNQRGFIPRAIFRATRHEFNATSRTDVGSRRRSTLSVEALEHRNLLSAVPVAPEIALTASEFGEPPCCVESPSSPVQSSAVAAEAGIPGDADGNSIVDYIDFQIWSEHYLQPGDMTNADGDFNGDGTVDGADYTTWADHRTNSNSPVESPAESAAVPVVPIPELMSAVDPASVNSVDERDLPAEIAAFEVIARSTSMSTALAMTPAPAVTIDERAKLAPVLSALPGPNLELCAPSREPIEQATPQATSSPITATDPLSWALFIAHRASSGDGPVDDIYRFDDGDFWHVDE
jgi:hypothetical protein